MYVAVDREQGCFACYRHDRISMARSGCLQLCKRWAGVAILFVIVRSVVKVKSYTS